MQAIMKNRRAGVLACTKWLLLLPAVYWYAADVSAGEWEFDPRVVVGGLYDDNHRLDDVAADKIAVYGTQADAGVTIHGLWPTWDFILIPYASDSYFPGHTNQDDDIESLTLKLNHTGERIKSTLAAVYSQRTLLTQLLPTTDMSADLGEPSPGTSPGLLEQRNRQDLLDVNPSSEFELTPRSQLVLRADYVDATYDLQTPGYYVNYNNVNGSLGWAYQLSPRGTLSLTGSGTQFSPAQGADARTYGLTGQWYDIVTQTARYYFRAGVNHTDFTANATTPGISSSSANDLSLGAGVTWTFQVTSVFLDLTRSVNPGPSGVAVDQDQLRFRLERRYTQRMAAFIGVVGVKQDPLGNSPNAADYATSYASGTAGFEWRFQREFALVGSYVHIWQKLGILPNSASSDTVRISFVYEPHRPAEGPAISVPY